MFETLRLIAAPTAAIQNSYLCQSSKKIMTGGDYLFP